MIEELRDYLIRQGWAEDIADDVHDAYVDARGTMQEMASIASKALTWADDEEHDYSGEMLDDILKWQIEVGERSEA